MDKSRRGMLSAVLPLGAAAITVGAVKAATAPSPVQSLTTAVNSIIPGVGSFVGTFTLTATQVINGVLSAVGTLNGVFTSVSGATQAVNQTVTAALSASGSCQILTLTIGPIYLNLLGLVVTLNQINLNITAVPSAGNLLGNLLCDVANLLNSGGPISTLLNNLSGLLNQIIAAL